MQLFDSVIRGLGSALGLYEARHNLLTQNIANVETPGYRARELDFGSALQDAFAARGDGMDPAGVSAGAVIDRDAVTKADGNTVDLDTQMTRLSENTVTIVALSQILDRKLDGLKRVLDEVKR